MVSPIEKQFIERYINASALMWSTKPLRYSRKTLVIISTPRRSEPLIHLFSRPNSAHKPPLDGLVSILVKNGHRSQSD